MQDPYFFRLYGMEIRARVREDDGCTLNRLLELMNYSVISRDCSNFEFWAAMRDSLAHNFVHFAARNSAGEVTLCFSEPAYALSDYLANGWSEGQFRIPAITDAQFRKVHSVCGELPILVRNLGERYWELSSHLMAPCDLNTQVISPCLLRLGLPVSA